VAKKEITALSSAAEKAQAAGELRSARQELQRWLDDRRIDPSTPRDVFEGVDYGPLITNEDLNRQSKIIASRYDYVDFGQLTADEESGNNTLRFTVANPEFFVPGFGSNADSISTNTAPSNALISTDDAYRSAARDPVAPSAGFAQGNGYLNGAMFDDARRINVGDRMQQLDAADPKIQGLGSLGTVVAPAPTPDSLNTRGLDIGTVVAPAPGADSLNTRGLDIGNVVAPGADSLNTRRLDIGTVVAPDPTPDSLDPRGLDQRNTNARPTVRNYYNLDDSGDVSGTGIEQGTGTVVNPLDAFGGAGGSVDTDRTDTASGSPVGEDPLEPFGGAGGDVDVSTLSQPRNVPGSQLYEENVADLEARPNVLHNYVNWTYQIGMYMLTPDSFINIVENGGVTNPGVELQNLLFRSGGAGRKGVLGEQKDYHIDSLRFTSVVGQNSQGAKSSNNFDISFDIIEPYGAAFLAELVQLALTLGIEDHFEVPYLLEIKFNGYDSAGNPIPDIPGSGPKYIPIKIIDIKFSINSAATVYHVRAVPYAHTPLQDQHDAYIKESVSLKGETFEQLIGNLQEHLNQREATVAEEENRAPDTYEFVIHDNDLRKSRVGFTHATEGAVIDVARQSMNGETSENVQINANSTVKSAVQAIVGATDFGARFNTTGTPESEQGNENRPMRMLKIVPVVTDLGPYNTSTMRYRKSVTFRLETQKMYGFLTAGMPGAGAQRRGWQKEYNWIFTGKNQDIIDFNADYNLQYFNIRNAFQNSKGRVTGAISNTGQSPINSNQTRTAAGGFTFNPAIRTASQPVTDQVYNSYRGPGHQQASDNMDNVLNNPGADMLVVDLTIIGDPDFIPQDRSILPRGITSSGNARIINGSLAVDSHDTFVMLKFKTPRDYDPEKGLMKIDTEQTFIQGLYRVITLESTFESGQFQQKLKLIRVQNQVSNDSSNIPPLTGAVESAARYYTSISSDPERGNLTDRLDTKGQIQTNSKVKVQTFLDPGGDPAETTPFGFRNAPSAPFVSQQPSQDTEDLFEDFNRGSNFDDTDN